MKLNVTLLSVINFLMGSNFFGVLYDGYYMVCKPITLPCILFMFIGMKFIHYHSYVMFVMNLIACVFRRCCALISYNKI